MSKTKEQQQAIQSIQQNTAVIAGAGSGKTMVLVERFLHLLASGTDCAKILAITFTNKAASEMRERIIKQINEKIADKSLDTAFWQQQKNNLAKCYIGTIHGLCINIISQYPLQAGTQPDFSVIDESRASLFLQKSVQKSLKELVEQKDESVVFLLDAYGYKTLCSMIADLVSDFCVDEVQKAGFQDSLLQGHKKYAAYLPQLKIELLESLAALIDNKDNLKKSVHRGNIEQLSEKQNSIIEAIAALPNDLTKLEFLQESLRPLKAQSADKHLVFDVKEKLASLTACMGDFLATKIVERWANVLKKAVIDYTDFKVQNAFLDFSDFEISTYKLLKSSPDLAKQISKEYEYIMVDEFQDTNDLQKSILYCLASGDDKALCGEKLFVVGDDNQSIYRFRGADVSVFAAVRADIENLYGSKIELLQNFRSTDSVLNVCNDVFSNLLGDKYNKLICGKTEQESLFDVEVLQEDEIVSDADLLSKRFVQLHSLGFEYKDMAILLRTKTRLNEYTAALERQGIDFCILDGQGFYQAQEVVDVLNLLRFLDNRLKDSSLIGILRSPLFGIDDKSLTLVSLSNKADSFWQKICLFDSSLLNGAQTELFELAKVRLEHFLQQASIMPLGALVRCLFDGLKISQLCSVYADFAQRYANLEKFIDIVFNFEQEYSGTLPEFLNYVDELISIDAREGLEQIQNQDSNALKILTVHKSKGLQFKVVALPDCAAGFFNDKKTFFYNKGEGLAIKPRDTKARLMDSLFLNNLKQLDKQENIKEMQRLFYVAMTRAEQKLIFTKGDRTKNAGDSWWSWLQDSFTQKEDYLVGTSGKIALVSVDDKEQLAPPCCEVEKQELCLTELLALATSDFASAKPQIDFSATSLRDFLHCERLFYYKYILHIEEFFSKTKTTTPAYVIGLFAHLVLTTFSNVGFDRAFLLACEKYSDIAQNELCEIKIWLKDYIDGDLFKQLSSGSCFYEKSFHLKLLEENYFLGSIDCVQVVDNCINIIDFKTDRQIGDLTGYEYQLLIYALAAQKLYPDKKIDSLKLHFVRLNKQVQFDFYAKEKELTDKITSLCEQIKAKNVQMDFIVNTTTCDFCGYNYFCLK